MIEYGILGLILLIGVVLVRLRIIAGRLPVIYIEGNVGAGKSTVIRRLKWLKGYNTEEEPISQWTNVGGFNMLGLLLADPREWAFTFQALVLVTAWEQAWKNRTGPIILERSMHSVLKLFTVLNYQAGFISEQQFATLKLMFRLLRVSLGRPEHFIYLQTSPATAYTRTVERGREEERGLELDFFVRMHQRMEQWLLQEELNPVTIINADQPKSVVFQEVENVIKLLGY